MRSGRLECKASEILILSKTLASILLTSLGIRHHCWVVCALTCSTDIGDVEQDADPDSSLIEK